MKKTPQTEKKEKKEIVKTIQKSAVNSVKETKTAVKKAPLTKVSKEAANQTSFDAYKIIKSPLSTEKCIRQVEYENKIGFVIDRQASKKEVKKAVEELFKVKVIKVNLQNMFNGEKRAYVKLSKNNLASDLSADLGLI